MNKFAGFVMISYSLYKSVESLRGYGVDDAKELHVFSKDPICYFVKQTFSADLGRRVNVQPSRDCRTEKAQ